MTASRDQLVEALRHALGGKWARVIRKGDHVPDAETRGVLGRRTHLLTVDVRGSDPPLQLICALPRAPSVEDTLLASAVARSFAPERRPQPRGQEVDLVLAALSGAHPEPDAVLGAAIALGSAAGGALLAEGQDTIATQGTGRPVLRRAAQEASRASEAGGTIELDGRTFLALPLPGGGGLALEAGRDCDALRTFLSIVGAAMAPAVPTPGAPSAAASGDLAAAASALPMAALLVDEHGRLAGASPRAEQVLGLTADFDLGTPVAGKLRSAELEAVAAGRVSQAEVVLAGSRFFATMAPLPSGGRIVTMIDRSAEENLDRIQEDLVSTVAHELRTPVAALTGLIQLLRLRAAKIDPEKLQMLLADGEREVVRLERMVEDLLLTARIATGGLLARPDQIDMYPVAADVVQHLEQRYPEHRFVVEGDAEAHADPTLVRHALWHLVDNAAKYSPAGSQVRVEISQTDSTVEARVVDEGPGIFTGDIPNLFQRFRQIDASHTRAHGGSGLGLFIAKAVLDAQGGQIFVRSKLGQGSTFGIRLPVARD